MNRVEMVTQNSSLRYQKR